MDRRKRAFKVLSKALSNNVNVTDKTDTGPYCHILSEEKENSIETLTAHSSEKDIVDDMLISSEPDNITSLGSRVTITENVAINPVENYVSRNTEKQDTLEDLEEGRMILDSSTGLFIISENSSEELVLDPVSGLFVHELPDSQEVIDHDSSEAIDSDVTYCEDSSEFEGPVEPPKKRTRNRKGMANPKEWTQNKKKIAREIGEAYISAVRKKGSIVGMKERKKRVMLPKCFSPKCEQSKLMKCYEIDDDNRKQIFNAFWSMKKPEKKTFIAALVTKVPVTRRTTKLKSRRNYTLQYNFQVEGQRKRVCKKTFLATLCIGEATVLSWINEASDVSQVARTDRRGRKAKEDSSAKLKHVTNFLDKIPKMESHYCRQSTSKEYFEVNYQSLKQVYKEFEKHFDVSNLPKGEKLKYNRFRVEVQRRNIGLFRPRKDQCDLCFSYKIGNLDHEEYSAHIANKNRARQEKHMDKLAALSNLIRAYTVDVQAVQLVPYSQAGALYFKLKLACHQFTIYNLATDQAICYVWHEGSGEMNANMFASCLLDYLESQEFNLPIVIYSDGCAAQNRNVTLANALQYFCYNKKCTISQKYLQKGHTQMECDSVHSHIEKVKKYRELHVPADFVKIIKEASSSQKYDVKYLQWNFFKNFEELNYLKSIRPGKKSGDPCVTDIKALKYSPNDTVKYKLNFDDEWSTLPQRYTPPKANTALKGLYSGPLPIAKRKYDDLQSLKSVIPKDFHSFYDSLQYK